jgi:hypothetical protein
LDLVRTWGSFELELHLDLVRTWYGFGVALNWDFTWTWYGLGMDLVWTWGSFELDGTDKEEGTFLNTKGAKSAAKNAKHFFCVPCGFFAPFAFKTQQFLSSNYFNHRIERIERI